ncbi:hypothetical protein SprV_0301042000 [Sparganum proliferum]
MCGRVSSNGSRPESWRHFSVPLPRARRFASGAVFQFLRRSCFVRNYTRSGKRLQMFLAVAVGPLVSSPDASWWPPACVQLQPQVVREDSCEESNYVGETGRLLRTRIAEHVAAVRRNDANSQVTTHSTRPGHTFKFDEAEILAGGDNRVSRELLESWFTGSQSINKCNDIPTAYSVLRHRLAKAIDHSGRAQAGEPDGRIIITPASDTGDEITEINNLHAGHQAISAPAGSNP